MLDDLDTNREVIRAQRGDVAAQFYEEGREDERANIVALLRSARNPWNTKSRDFTIRTLAKGWAVAAETFDDLLASSTAEKLASLRKRSASASDPMVTDLDDQIEREAP